MTDDVRSRFGAGLQNRFALDDKIEHQVLFAVNPEHPLASNGLRTRQERAGEQSLEFVLPGDIAAGAQCGPADAEQREKDEDEKRAGVFHGR